MHKSKKIVKNKQELERKIVPVLKIALDSTSREGALSRAWEMGYGGNAGYGGKRPKLVVTPNPEIILAGSRDKKLAQILNSASLSVPDGVGSVLAMRYLTFQAPRNPLLRAPVVFLQGVVVGLAWFLDREWILEASEIVPGRWLFEELARKAAKEGKRVFLLGGKPGVAEKVSKNLNDKWPMLSEACRFAVNAKCDAGPLLDSKGVPVGAKQMMIEKDIVRDINRFKPHFLFVGFGHPKQEKWLARNLPKLNVGMAMTVGGAFDYLAGQVPRPPLFLSRWGLEWLWRLVTQPWRVGRIIRAVVIFPLALYLYRLGSKE